MLTCIDDEEKQFINALNIDDELYILLIAFLKDSSFDEYACR